LVIRRRWLVPLVPLFAACAQVIGADFDGLVPGGSSGGAEVGGSSGSSGGATSSGGNGGTGGSGGGAAGAGTGGAVAGAAGDVIKDASSDQGSGGATLLPDGSKDATASDVAAVDHQDAAAMVDVATGPGSVVINEIKGQGAGSDWIELYNPGQGPMDLSGYTIAQAMGATGPPDPTSFLTFPAGTTLAGGAFLMVVAQQASIGGPTTACEAIAASCFTVDWGIAMGGERIYLLNPQADGGRSVHQQVDYLASVMSGQTFARASNGTFQAASPTPGQPNGI
jgi:hypothetical protein